MSIEKPGLYKNLSNEDYHKSPGLSNSTISDLIDPNCPAFYYYKHLSGKYIREPKDHFDLGTAIHTLVFEPETFESRFHIIKKINKQSKKGKDEHALQLLEAGGKDVLTEPAYNKARWMADNVLRHPLIKYELKNGCIEDSIMWQESESGTLLRTRPDFYNEDFILDLKTTKDITLEGCSKSINEYSYYRQGAMACDGLTEVYQSTFDTVITFFVAKEPPHLVRALSIVDKAIKKGRREYKKGAAIYQQCFENNYWPGYPEIIDDIDLPRWAYKGDEYDY